MKQIILLKSIGIYILYQIYTFLYFLLNITGLYSYNILGSKNVFNGMKYQLFHFQIKLQEYYLNNKITGNTNTIFLSNHRGISDYFIDSYITGGSSLFSKIRCNISYTFFKFRCVVK